MLQYLRANTLDVILSHFVLNIESYFKWSDSTAPILTKNYYYFVDCRLQIVDCKLFSLF